MKTAIVVDNFFIKHSAGQYHPESPERLIAIYKKMEPLKNRLVSIKTREATTEELKLVHSESYIELINKLRDREFSLDADTAGNNYSAEAAFLAAGSSVELSKRILKGEFDNGFAIIRPPGHHAEYSRAMGFCIFNNVAVAAANLLTNNLAKRILIVDWDIHHGNGTMHSFYNRDDVLYFSTHLYPYYPGTGYYDETGENQGKGYTINVPLTAYKSDNDFLYIFDNLLTPVMDKYKPEIILVSAGFDIYYRDPLGSMKVTEEGFYKFTEFFKYLAKEYCNNRLCLFLEGGYNVEGLANSVYRTLESLINDKIEKPTATPTSQEVLTIVEKVKSFNPIFY